MKKIIFFLILLGIILISLIFYWQGIYLPKDASSQIRETFLIKEGEGTREIALHLERQSLIKSGPLFRLYTLFKGVSGNLQAGHYLLSPSMTIPEITEKFVKGDVIKIVVTIPEGFTLNQIEERLSERGLIGKSEIRDQKVKIYKEEFNFLKDVPEETTLEGFLFPDTYQFFFKAGVEEIIGKMLANFDKKLTEDLREEINRQKKSIFEIVTMASLIEKEVKTFEDKKLVSGILWKRRYYDIPLQVDATIGYITGKKTTKISKTDFQIDSPYNTYKYKGLPLGPISNPGLESILASVYPESSDYWYYLSTPEGRTIFSKTLEEHNLAKAKYLR